jgi:hypothetical protein
MLAEIKRRRSGLAKLISRRRKLARQLAKLDQQIARVGGVGGGASAGRSGAGRRPRNKITLSGAMVKVMSATKAMSVAQIAAAVRKIGYKSVSKTFNTIIFQTLGRDKQFKKKSRGQYVLRG